MKSISIVPLLLLALAACSGDRDNVNLGDDNLGSAAQTLEDYAGVWDGYVEAFQFDSGSDRLRLTLDAQGNGALEFGDQPAIAPFSNPAIGYPEEEPFTDPSFIPRYTDPHEGFAYPVHEAAVTDGRVKLIAWGTDIVSNFCAAQAPLDSLETPLRYNCSPVGGGIGANATGQCLDSRVGSSTFGMSFDCGVALTCAFGCVCDATSCSAPRRENEELTVDGALKADGNELVGTLLLGPADDKTRVTVRLTKQ